MQGGTPVNYKPQLDSEQFIVFNFTVKLSAKDIKALEQIMVQKGLDLLQNKHPEIYVKCCDSPTWVDVKHILESLGYSMPCIHALGVEHGNSIACIRQTQSF